MATVGCSNLSGRAISIKGLRESVGPYAFWRREIVESPPTTPQPRSIRRAARFVRVRDDRAVARAEGRHVAQVGRGLRRRHD